MYTKKFQYEISISHSCVVEWSNDFAFTSRQKLTLSGKVVKKYLLENESFFCVKCSKVQTEKGVFVLVIFSFLCSLRKTQPNYKQAANTDDCIIFQFVCLQMQAG
jgi:hypothetical protein